MNIFVYGGLLNVSSDCSFSLSREFVDIFVHVIYVTIHGKRGFGSILANMRL